MQKKKVYISSTFKDLKEYRTLVIALFQNQLKESFELSKIMERMWDDGSQTPFVEECVREVKACDVYLIILGNKVGSFPPNENRTYTEIELDTAFSEKKTMFFLHLTAFDSTKIDNPVKHDELLSKFEGKPVHLFQNEIELKSELLECLIPLIQQINTNPPATLLSPNGSDNPTVFLGREDELRTIRERLDKSGKLMLINSEGGIGKTTLAAKYWNESLYDYKHNAWLFCENGIVNALKELAPKLNVDLAGMNEAQQVAALKHALSQVHDGFLLVLDNANDEDDIRVFKQTFEGFHWHVLITSRCQGVLDPAQELPITHLPPPLAKDLFVHFYKENTPEFDALLDKLLLAINYHTLLIEVFAKNLNEASEMGMTLKTFLQNLEAEGLHLKEHNFEVQSQWSDKRQKATVNDILDAIYDFTKLPTSESTALLNLAFLPVEPYDLPFLFTLFTEKATELPFRNDIKALVKKGWLSQTDKTYKLSPVIQALVLEKYEHNLDTAAQGLLDKLNDILECDAYNLLNISLTDAEKYIKPVSHLSKCLKKHPSWDIGNYNYSAGIYYKNIGDIVTTQATQEQYQAIYKELLAQNPENLGYKNGLAISYENLGNVYNAKDDWKNALSNFQERLRIFKEIYASSPENLRYKNNLALSYQFLGIIYEKNGDLGNALSNYKEFNRIFKEIYVSSPENLEYQNNLAISYQFLGIIYEKNGDLGNALINYEEFNRIEKEIYASSPENLEYKNGLALSYQFLGILYEKNSDLKNALSNYEEYNRIAKEINKSSPENLYYKNSLAISYDKLGRIYAATGDLKNALANFQEKYLISKEICESSPENLEYKSGLAVSYYYLGKLLENDNLPEAISHLKISVKLYEEINEIAPEIVKYAHNLRVIKGYLEELMRG